MRWAWLGFPAGALLGWFFGKGVAIMAAGLGDMAAQIARMAGGL